jgi:hypothetical protein
VGAVRRVTGKRTEGYAHGKDSADKPSVLVTHASSKRGVVVDPLIGRLLEKLTKTVGLTIGEKK